MENKTNPILGTGRANPAVPTPAPKPSDPPVTTPAPGTADGQPQTAGEGQGEVLEDASLEAKRADGLEVSKTDKQKDGDAVIESPKSISEQNELVRKNMEAGDDVAARWSSHPIMRYSVGDYHFEQGLLVLRTQKEADAFEKVVEELPLSEQSRIRKLDLDAARRISAEYLANSGGTTRSIDSSAGDRAPNNQVGKGDLLDANRS